MEYTVQKLAKLAGISARTLRHYDQIGLLRPARLSSSGYRIYGAAEVALLQQILFYRALEVPLEEIRELVHAPGFDALEALRAHKQALLSRRDQLDALLGNLTRTITHLEGGIRMSDSDRFTEFREKMIADNETKYGKEIRERYGEETVEASNKRLRNMSQETFEKGQKAAEEANAALVAAMDGGDPASDAARHAVALHHAWLQFWGDYTPEMHVGLGQMYVDDERFAAHYDALRPGAAVFLRDAIAAYYKQD